MFTIDDLRHGLEWIEGKSKITINYNGSYVDIFLYHDYPNEDKPVRLSIYIDELNMSVRLNDLIGNGYHSECQGHGYGKLIVNIGIQTIYAFFGIQIGDPSAEQISADGKVSNQQDPTDEPYRSECRDRRNGMWSAFGFTLAEPHEFNTVMKAALSQLRLLDGAPTRNNTPRLVNLDQFWLKGSTPPLDQSDIQKLRAFDVDQFNLDDCPSKDEIETLFNAGKDWQIGLRRIILFIVGGGTLVMASNIFDPFTSVAISALSFVFVYFYPFSHIERLLQWLTPHYEKHHRLCDVRNKMLKNVRDYIIEFERSHNGLLWRLHQHLGSDENFSYESFNVLSAASKQQNPYFLADNYHQYILYIASAKKHFQFR